MRHCCISRVKFTIHISHFGFVARVIPWHYQDQNSLLQPGQLRKLLNEIVHISAGGAYFQSLWQNRYRAANLSNIISVFCWKNFRILSNFSVSLNLSLTRLKTFIRQLPIYSGGTHPLPVETLVDSFGTTGTGSEARKRVTTTCGREKIERFGD